MMYRLGLLAGQSWRLITRIYTGFDQRLFHDWDTPILDPTACTCACHNIPATDRPLLLAEGLLRLLRH